MEVLKELNTSYVPAIITGIFLFASGFLLHYLTTKRTLSEMTRSNYQKQLELILVPIVNIFDEAIEPTFGYEGLNDSNVDNIVMIVRGNTQFVDCKLIHLVNVLVEKQYISNSSEANYPNYDENRKFLDYVLTRYNWIRKQLRLPYESDYLFPRNLFKKVGNHFRPVNRRLLRKLRKCRPKRKSDF
jgi:hypothetical protein